MTTSYLQLTAHDPIVARDGRPFGFQQGNRMRCLPWPYPSVVAGSFRTALVKATKGRDFSGDTPQQLLALAVAGVFPVAAGRLYLPAPNDCVLHPDRGALAVLPQYFEEGEGCDLPRQQLRPALLSFRDSEHEFKPRELPAWWPVEKLAHWLTAHKLEPLDDTFLLAACSQVRDHVQLDPDTGAAAESRLFATEGLSLTHLPRYGVTEGRWTERTTAITLVARVEAEGWDVSGLNLLHPLGGERRLVHWQANGTAQLWQCPGEVVRALADTRKLRMVLATPAVFEHGWRPSWLDADTLSGRPPWWPEAPNLRLVGVCIPRWKAVSGWSLAEPRGPKPVKRLVPAGGVYFFETDENPAALAARWLHPVSDDAQDRRDGFGLVVWGAW